MITKTILSLLAIVGMQSVQTAKIEDSVAEFNTINEMLDQHLSLVEEEDEKKDEDKKDPEDISLADAKLIKTNDPKLKKFIF